MHRRWKTRIETKTSLGLSFELLNDSSLELATALRLPTFEFAGMQLIRRLTVIAVDGTIRKVF